MFSRHTRHAGRGAGLEWARGRAGGANVEDEQPWFALLLVATEIEGRANVLSDSLDKMQG